jgi:hypothetical protein
MQCNFYFMQPNFVKFLLLMTSILIWDIEMVFSNEYKLKVELKATDCINCISYIQLFEKLNSNINTYFIYRNANDSAVIAEFISNYNPSLILKPDKNYGDIESSEPYSMVYFFIDTSLIFSFPLTKLNDRITIINQLTRKSKDLEIDSVSIKSVISKNAELIIHQKKKFIFDSFLNKILVFDESSQEYKPFFKPNPNFNVSLCILAQLDTTRYIKFDKILAKYGKSNLKLNSISINGEDVWATSTLSYPIIDRKDTILENFYFLIKIKENKIEKAYYIKDSTMSQKSKYFFDDSNSFCLKDSSIYLGIYKENTNSENLLLSKWKFFRENLIFESFENFKLPDLYVSNKFDYDYTHMGVNQNSFFIQNYPIIHNIPSSKTFDFKSTIEKLENSNLVKERVPQIYIYDCLYKDELIWLTYNYSGKVKIVIVTQNNQLVKKIDLPENIFFKSLKFTSYSSLAGLNGSSGKIFTINFSQ